MYSCKYSAFYLFSQECCWCLLETKNVNLWPCLLRSCENRATHSALCLPVFTHVNMEFIMCKCKCVLEKKLRLQADVIVSRE